MVFQNYALYPHMCVFKNMAYGLKLRKISKVQIRDRVAMGRAIVRNPSVFLFDEPLSNLDAKLRASMRVELKKLHAALKTTMIYVTHDQVEAMTLADRILKSGVSRSVEVTGRMTTEGCSSKRSDCMITAGLGFP